MKKLFTSLAIMAISTAFGQEIKTERLHEIVSTLASDEMKGRKVGTEENLKAAQYISNWFKANNLEYCAGNSYLVPFTLKDMTVYNVCGIKKGESGKYIGIGAHFDHVGEKKTKTEDSIFNGADDNASGVSVVVGLADYFKTKKVKDGLVFMAFNAEEIGLVGSRELANDAHFDPIVKNMKVLFNFEMLGTESAFGPNAVYMTGDDFSNLDEELNKFAANNLKIAADPYKEHQLFYRSDNANFAKKGVVAHSFSTVNMEKQKHYHQVNDEISIINFSNLTTLANSFAKTIEKFLQANPKIEYNKKP